MLFFADNNRLMSYCKTKSKGSRRWIRSARSKQRLAHRRWRWPARFSISFAMPLRWNLFLAITDNCANCWKSDRTLLISFIQNWKQNCDRGRRKLYGRNL